MTSENTAADQARATRFRVAFELKGAQRHLEEATAWMRVDAGVSDVDAEVLNEYGIRVRGYLRKYDLDDETETPKDFNTQPIRPTRTVRIQNIDDAV